MSDQELKYKPDFEEACKRWDAFWKAIRYFKEWNPDWQAAKYILKSAGKS